MLIINAEIHTMENGEILSNAFLHTKGDKITKIGSMKEELPSDSIVFDAKNMKLYPGFIDAHTHLGMWEDGLNFEGDDGNEDTDPALPHLRAKDAVNPFDHCFEEAASAGVTCVVTGPGSANPIGGQLLAMKTQGRFIEEMEVLSPAAMKMALGENPKSVYHAKNETPVTRMATAAIIREHLFKAKRYMDEIEKSKEDEDCDPPEFDIKLEALVPVLKREVPVHFHCHRRDDILTAVRIAEEFNIAYVLVHATEGYMISDILKEKNARIFSGPILCDRSKPELKNLDPSGVGKLFKSGVRTAIVTDHPVIPIQYLPFCAAIAVREGLSYEEAVEAITIIPAQICGISHRVGSIKEGKDADFLIFESDPLSIYEKPKFVSVSGKAAVNKL